MPSPFPGIDPFLESQHFWEDFHPSFLTYCRDALNEILPAEYVAQLGERIRLVELSQKKAKLVLPDIAVIEEADKPSRRVAHRSKVAGVLTLEPVTIPLPSVEMEIRDVWIEIRRGTSRAPVTVIELLSPTNKTGDGFVEYKLKRRSLIRQKIHLVELDLLLGGRRLPMSLPLPVGDYFAFISRAQRRPNSDVYAWTVRDALPSVPIPLMAGTPDVALDLADVFATTYERGRYARLIDYAAPPSVLRKPEDRAWAQKQARRGRR
jgi:Protein of unknown function (DUF4058)